MLTTRSTRDEIDLVDGRARELVLDALAAGIEPERVTFYHQSAVPEIHELASLLQSLVTVNRLARIPALKEIARDAEVEMSFALLGYPVLEPADILSIRAEAVPVRKDIEAFVEVKERLVTVLNAVLDPMRERRERFAAPGLVEELLVTGTTRVREETRATVLAVRKAMGFTGVWNRLRRRVERAGEHR